MSENYALAWMRADVTEKHIILVLSIIGGMLGFDQAYKGSIVLAFFKAITLGGLFIWYILDIWGSARTASTTMHLYKEYLRKQDQKN